MPISLTFKGRYFGLQKLLKLLRQSADVSGGKIVVQGPALHRGQHHVHRRPADGEPVRTRLAADIQATIALNAFVYQAAAAGQ